MKCKTCGSDITDQSDILSRVIGDRHFCSVTCYNTYKDKKIMIKKKLHPKTVGATRSGINMGAYAPNPGTLIYENPVYKPMSSQQQKHEEIKRKAWEYLLHYPDKEQTCSVKKILDSFKIANDFYDYAKQKEKIKQKQGKV